MFRIRLHVRHTLTDTHTQSVPFRFLISRGCGADSGSRQCRQATTDSLNSVCQNLCAHDAVWQTLYTTWQPTPVSLPPEWRDRHACRISEWGTNCSASRKSIVIVQSMRLVADTNELFAFYTNARCTHSLIQSDPLNWKGFVLSSIAGVRERTCIWSAALTYWQFRYQKRKREGKRDRERSSSRVQFTI